jgi:chromate transporter
VVNKKNFLNVMLSFLKIGAIGFGGGSALIPVIEREVVENKQWIGKEEFDVSVAITSMAPASIPVSLCCIWDMKYAVVSAFSYALPGSLIYLILLTGFSFFGETGAKYLRYASVVLICFVLFIIFRFIKNKYAQGVKTGRKAHFLMIMSAAFLLACGSAVERLAGLFAITLPPPLFSVNMITLILILFFAVSFVGESKSIVKLVSALLLSTLFALSNGRAGIISNWTLPLAFIMSILSITSILRDTKKNKKKTTDKPPFRFDYKPLLNLTVFITVSLILAVTTFIISGDANVWWFMSKSITSALSSFGGGEAFIGISEAAFVQTGFIPESIYNTQILGIANSMPGPVLMSICTGVGYTYGYVYYGVSFGWMFGLLGFSSAVTATAVGATTLLTCYRFIKDSNRVKTIIKYVMPVVCGMLISTALSLFRQALSVVLSFI